MKRILVVDDDPAIRLLYQEELLEEGYDVLSSDGGAGVLQLIAEQKPHLILLDLKLGNRNALDLLQEIRKEWWTIPVILLTAYPSFKLHSKSLAVAASVSKDSDLTGLKQQIAKCLNPPATGIPAGKSPQAEAAKPRVQLGMRFHE
jgi:DNA-binding response OmpR family regulator